MHRLYYLILIDSMRPILSNNMNESLRYDVVVCWLSDYHDCDNLIRSESTNAEQYV